MSYMKENGMYTFICDSCGEYFSGEPDEAFGEAWGSARAAGWRSIEEDGEWQDRCPECGLR
jgi:hypothetical protein